MMEQKWFFDIKCCLSIFWWFSELLNLRSQSVLERTNSFPSSLRSLRYYGNNNYETLKEEINYNKPGLWWWIICLQVDFQRNDVKTIFKLKQDSENDQQRDQ